MFKKILSKKAFWFSVVLLVAVAGFSCFNKYPASIETSNPVNLEITTDSDTFESDLLAVNLGDQKYEDELSFVAIAKNEGPYIREWIEFHKLVGVTKFYIYDNESTDGLKDILQDYIDNGEVVYKYQPGKGQQLIVYKEAVDNYKDKTKYMGFVDLDEFVIPVEKSTVTEAIDEIMQKDDKIAAVGVNWLVYGSSGLVDKPDGLVTENYKYRAIDNFEANRHIKTICNPRKASQPLDPHSFSYSNGYYCVNEDGEKVPGAFNENCKYKKLRMNHYFCKSQSEYVKKKNRGLADHTDELKRTMADFHAHDKNDIYDYSMEKYVAKLKGNPKVYNSVEYLHKAKENLAA